LRSPHDGGEAAAGAEHAPGFGDGALEIDEHQHMAGDDRVEARVLELERRAIHGADGDVVEGGLASRLDRGLHHRGRSIDGDDVAALAHSAGGEQGGVAGAGAEVEHARAGDDVRLAQHELGGRAHRAITRLGVALPRRGHRGRRPSSFVLHRSDPPRDVVAIGLARGCE
jgi:hypothetical protein